MRFNCFCRPYANFHTCAMSFAFPIADVLLQDAPSSAKLGILFSDNMASPKNLLLIYNAIIVYFQPKNAVLGLFVKG